MKLAISVQTALVSFLTVAALLLLCAILAKATWAWLAPAVEAPAPVAMQDSADLQAAYTLFGTSRQTQALDAATGIAIKLLGIVAATGKNEGYAVVRLEPDKILVLHEGQEFAPGIRLLEVNIARLVLERGGVRETLGWPKQ